jgi:aerobic-type carbon monoxide dehydrogenase small subunit (CoxS/CutS family)
METTTIQLTLNGQTRTVIVDPRRLLSDVIRVDLGLTGTNVGCEQGICGSCTVLVDGRTARSCLMFAVQAAGAEITTVEGLSADGTLSALQESFREHQALQCGFCTPGFLMTATELLEAESDPDEETIRAALAGNICRCTGYEHIVDAVRAAAAG